MKDLRSLFDDFEKDINGDIEVAGWIRTIRSSKNVGFIELNDGSCLRNVQIVYERDKIDDFDGISGYSSGSAITVEGTLVKTPGLKQPFEIHAREIKLEAESAPDYPLQKKRHSFEYLRTIAHLRPRTNTFAAMFRLRSVMSYAIHSFFNGRGFVYVHTPIITSSDCEGAGDIFKVTTLDFENPPLTGDGTIDYGRDFFGKKTGLTVSGQLNGEAYCLAFKNIYTFGPTFRAENSNTARHASEFWMVEPEIAFAGLDENMALAEDMTKYLVNYAFEHGREEMEFFGNFIDKNLFDKLENVLREKFERLTYTDAVKILQKEGGKFEYPVYWGGDLQTEHERFLTEKVFKKPVFVTDYPKEIKAFYMRTNDDGKTSAAMDLLVPGVGEIIGGSQREERPDMLKRRMEELQLDQRDYDWYMELRKYGGVRHAGFGLGFERFLMYISGMENIRDVIPFPRTVRHVDF